MWVRASLTNARALDCRQAPGLPISEGRHVRFGDIRRRRPIALDLTIDELKRIRGNQALEGAKTFVCGNFEGIGNFFVPTTLIRTSLWRLRMLQQRSQFLRFYP